MKENELSEEKKSFSYYLVYFITSIFINLLCVPLHESGHAVIYLFQGYEVSFHFTKADPANGIKTFLGVSGGLAFNIILALLFLYLFIKYKNILFYMLIVGNTLFIRIIGIIVTFIIGKPLKDESLIGNYININPFVIETFILIVFAVIFIIATKELLNQNTKKHSKYIILLTIISCIISLAILAPLDAKGI